MPASTVSHLTKINLANEHLKMLGLQLLKIATLDNSEGNQDYDLFTDMLWKVEADYRNSGMNHLMPYDAYREGFNLYGTLLDNVHAHLRP